MSIQESIRYGAAELKRFYNRNLGMALGISVGFHLLLIFLYVFVTTAKTKTTSGPPVVAKMKLENIAPPKEDNTPPPPPPPMIPQLQNTGGTGGVAARAGNLVAVPDAMVTPDMKDIAAFDQSAIAMPKAGDGTGLGGGDGEGLGAPIKLDEPVKNVDKEPDPAPDEFLPDATDPSFDLPTLQASVKYPEMAKRNNIEGKVIVRVLIDKTGIPKDYRIDYSDNKILEKAAVDAVMAYRGYSPGVQNTIPVKVWVSIPITFVLH